MANLKQTSITGSGETSLLVSGSSIVMQVTVFTLIEQLV